MTLSWEKMFRRVFKAYPKWSGFNRGRFDRFLLWLFYEEQEGCVRQCIEVASRAYVDLDQSEDEIIAGAGKRGAFFRKARHKASIRYFSGDEAFNNAQYLIKFLNPTRPYLVNCAISLCSQGQGEIAIAYNEKNEESAIIFVIDDEASSFYALGLCKRSKQNHTRLLLLDAFIRAKARGKKRFYLSHFNPSPVWINAQRQPQTFFKRPLNIRMFKDSLTETVELVQTYRIFV
jgi:hypothetical protein